MSLDEHGGWSGVLGRLTSGTDLSAEECTAVLGEDLAANDAEIDATYQLFLDVRSDGETAISNSCRGGGSSTDDNGTVIPWMAVVAYLIADYRFFYE